MVATSGISLFTASLAFIIYDVAEGRKALPKRIGILANILSFESISALDFRDRDVLSETLSSLKGDESLVAAGVYDSDDRLFAAYYRSSGNVGAQLAPHLESYDDQYYFTDDSLFVIRGILLGDRRLGALVVQADTRELTSRMKRSVSIVGVLFLLSIVVAVVIASKFQRVITAPILQLSSKAQEISNNQDYGIRAERTSDDELGVLVDSFNHMLTQIQQRDDNLKSLNEQLEDRVQERTRKLEVEIQDRKRAEEKIRVLNAELEDRVLKRTKQLELANKELESFAYTVSHDLRAPLRHAAGFAELLEECIAEEHEEPREYIQYINESVQKMDNLINDLLSFSRTGRQGMTITTVSMDKLITEIIDEFAIQIGDRTIKWDLSPVPDATADPTMMRLILSNLIGNAIKYTGTRDVARVAIGCSKDPAEGDDIYFVADNGVGFNMKYKDKLFGVFQRLHSNEEFEGTGIGLATVRRIVTRHKGRIWAESEVDKGTTLYFTIPKQETDV